jgi:hypothetical protein
MAAVTSSRQHSAVAFRLAEAAAGVKSLTGEVARSSYQE